MIRLAVAAEDRTCRWLKRARKFGFNGGMVQRIRVVEAKSSRSIRYLENKSLRIFMLALSVAGILAGASAAHAGPSTTERELAASVDPAMLSDEATRKTEDQIGLDKARRRDVQRRLTRLGFDTRINGRFDKSTREVIARWQAARGYPRTGFLSTSQHQALLTESISLARADSAGSDKANEDRPAHRRDRRAARRHGVGGPIGLIGGVVGGLFGRR